MKRIYIKPETKTLQLRLHSFIAASPTSGGNNTHWGTQTEGDPNTTTPIGGDGDDDENPNADSRWMRSSMWE